MENTNSTATNGHTHNGREDARAGWNTAPYNGDSVLILYGTVTGNAETLANKLAVSLRHAGVTARVRDMAHCQPSVLTQSNCVLVVISTYGDGEPPDDASSFWKRWCTATASICATSSFPCSPSATPPTITSASAAVTSTRPWSATAARASIRASIAMSITTRRPNIGSTEFSRISKEMNERRSPHRFKEHSHG